MALAHLLSTDFLETTSRDRINSIIDIVNQINIATGKTFTTTGNNITLNTTGDTTLTLPTTGVLATHSDKLSVFAATTSAELAGVISDETGNGFLVFSNGASLTGLIGINMTANRELSVNGSIASSIQSTDDSDVGLIMTATAGRIFASFHSTGSYKPIEFSVNGGVVLTLTTAGIAKLGSSVAVRGTTEGTTHLDIFDGTPPVGTLTNGISIYSQSGALKAMDASGTVVLSGTNTGDKTFDQLSPMTTAGDIIYGGVLGHGTRLGIGGANTVLHGGASAPAYSAVVEADITLSNNATNNATTSKHGFLPILSGNPLQFLDGNGNYSIPAAGAPNSYQATSFSGQTSVNVVHNFGTYPVVQIVDGSGAVLIPQSITNNTLNDFTVVFNTSTSGTIMATVGSPQPQALTVVNSGTYTVLITDRILKVTASGAIITLLTAVGNTGHEFIIDNATTGNITVNTTSSQTIDGVLSQTVPSSSAMDVYSDGANWRII